MRKILVVQPSFQPPGGGNAVASWMVQALADRCDVSVLVWRRFDPEPIDRFFGTSLGAARLTVHRIHPRVARLVDVVPTPHAQLRMSVMLRAARRLHRRHHFDVHLTANNEADFGVRGIQYVHYPWAALPRPRVDLRWYHLPGSLRLYWALCGLIAGQSWSRMRRNVTLVNSAFIAGRVREIHGRDPIVLHPPVPGTSLEVPWETRADGIVCIGRLSREKEQDKVIGIVAGVRARGHDLRLHLVGTPDDRVFGATLDALVRRHADWITVHRDLHRDALDRLIAHNRYGIHGMVEEHFGIAVAEMQRAGCVVFVPDSGGPLEIVGPDPRLHYASPDDAVAKIDRVLADPALQRELHAGACARRALFTTARFVDRVREIVETFEP